MATEILKKQTIVGTDAQYEANRNSYGEGTVFESTSLLGENDIDPAYTSKFVPTRKVTSGLYLYAFDSTGNISQSADTGKGAYTVARRSAGGTLSVGDPTSQYHAVNKAYADTRFRYTHLIEVKFNPAPEPYVSYVLIGIITYVSNSATPLTSIDQLPLDVALPIHGKLNIDNFHDTYTATRKTRKDGTSYLSITYMYYSDSDGIGTGTQGDIVPTSFTDTVV